MSLSSYAKRRVKLRAAQEMPGTSWKRDVVGWGRGLARLVPRADQRAGGLGGGRAGSVDSSVRIVLDGRLLCLLSTGAVGIWCPGRSSLGWSGVDHPRSTGLHRWQSRCRRRALRSWVAGPERGSSSGGGCAGSAATTGGSARQCQRSGSPEERRPSLTPGGAARSSDRRCYPPAIDRGGRMARVCAGSPFPARNGRPAGRPLALYPQRHPSAGNPRRLENRSRDCASSGPGSELRQGPHTRTDPPGPPDRADCQNGCRKGPLGGWASHQLLKSPKKCLAPHDGILAGSADKRKMHLPTHFGRVVEGRGPRSR
jgi:hypothetical protein